MKDIIMKGVREYGEEMEVSLSTDKESGRIVIYALNEAGCCCTEVDLKDVFDWVKANKPQLLEE